MKVLQKISKGLRTVSELLATALFSLLPRDRRRILFGAWAGMRYDDNSRVLYEYFLQHHPEYRVYWTTRNPEVLARMRGEGLPVCSIRSLKGFLAVVRSKFIVCTDSSLDYGWKVCSGGATIVNLWHGVGPKRIGVDVKGLPTRFGLFEKKVLARLVPMYLMSTSDAITERFSRTLLVAPERMRNLGQARNDYFFTPHDNPLRRRFPGARLVLYMPTFREDGGRRLPMDLDVLLDLGAIDELCRTRDMYFLVKFHQWTPGHVSHSYGRIVELTDGSLRTQELLDAADILVTDYSSCFVDHLMLDRPQLFYAYDLEHYKAKERDLYGDYLEDATGPVCRDRDSFIRALESIADGDDGFAAKRAEMLDFYYSPENQCAVAPKQADFIISLG